MSVFYANVAEVVVTPPIGVHLLEPRRTPATKVYDDLYARALALSDGDTTVVVVALDLVGLDFELVQRIRQAVAESAGVSSDHLMLTTTHTHSAPVTIGWDQGAQELRNRAWESQMVAAVADCVTRCVGNLIPATLSAGREPVQIGFNRRVSSLGGTRMAPNPAGPVAPWVDVLRVDHEGRRSLAVLLSHAAHPVVVHTAGTGLCADYPGAAVAALRSRLGDDVIGLFAQGCCADINAHPLGGGFEEARRVGAVLGEAAADAALASQPLRPGTLAVGVHVTSLPFEPLDEGVARSVRDRARESCAATEEAGATGAEMARQRELLLWAERMVNLAMHRDPPEGLPLEVQAFALGPDCALIGLMHEPFVEYQLFLQQQSPFMHTMVFGYTNGCADYVPTADAFALGGYEVLGGPQACMPALKADCESIMKNAGLSALNDVWNVCH